MTTQPLIKGKTSYEIVNDGHIGVKRFMVQSVYNIFDTLT